MEQAEGARTFQVSGDAYDRFMGRYSRQLAVAFADTAEVSTGQAALDVGCGPGALTRELAARLGAASVSAFDPSEPFVAACSAANPGVDVRVGRAEAIPFDDESFDRVLAQLVIHFVSEPAKVASEIHRVLRPNGIAGLCIWESGGGMEMLGLFWEAALAVIPDAPAESGIIRFGNPGEIGDLMRSAGFEDLTERTLVVSAAYENFDELWSGFRAGIGPAGAFCTALGDDQRSLVRAEFFRRVGSPGGAFSLKGSALSATGRKRG